MNTRTIIARLSSIVAIAIFGALAVVTTADADVHIKGVVHLEDVGDKAMVDSQWAGTKGERRRLEGFEMRIDPPVEGLKLEYMCHVEDTGDTSWMAEGTFCGTRGERRRVEGIAVRLTGPAASRFAVTYQCHLQDHGDKGPFENGTYCGTRNESKRLEALLVRIVAKGVTSGGEQFDRPQ